MSRGSIAEAPPLKQTWACRRISLPFLACTVVISGITIALAQYNVPTLRMAQLFAPASNLAKTDAPSPLQAEHERERAGARVVPEGTRADGVHVTPAPDGFEAAHVDGVPANAPTAQTAQTEQTDMTQGADSESATTQAQLPSTGSENADRRTDASPEQPENDAQEPADDPRGRAQSRADGENETIAEEKGKESKKQGNDKVKKKQPTSLSTEQAPDPSKQDEYMPNEVEGKEASNIPGGKSETTATSMVNPDEEETSETSTAIPPSEKHKPVSVPTTSDTSPPSKPEKPQQEAEKPGQEKQDQQEKRKRKPPIRTTLHPAEDHPSECFFATKKTQDNDESYPFNARSFCLTSATCFEHVTDVHVAPAVYIAASQSKTNCRAVTASLDTPTGEHINCTWLQEHVMCAHGAYEYPGDPICPTIKPIDALPSKQAANIHWLDEVAVLAPAYPYMGNIYHYSFIALSAIHISSALPMLLQKWQQRGSASKVVLPARIPVRLIFRGELPDTLGSWQEGVVAMLVQERLSRVGLDVIVDSWNETDAVKKRRPQVTCAKSAVLMGKRWALSLWPFPNSTLVDDKGDSVSVEAIAFRKAAYSTAKVTTLLPELAMGALTPPKPTALFDLPPRSIGYARRNGAPDPTPDNPFVEGTTRRFSDADEKWFVQMLRDVAKEASFTFRTLQTPGGTHITEQVRLFAGVGVIAGIHGANLVNAAFAPAFTALMEVRSIMSECYWAGANSGLAYWAYMPVRKATWRESGCLDENCDVNSRQVMIGLKRDRDSLRKIVQRQVDHIDRLHRVFGHLGGIPVKYDPVLAVFRIDWSKAKTKA